MRASAHIDQDSQRVSRAPRSAGTSSKSGISRSPSSPLRFTSAMRSSTKRRRSSQSVQAVSSMPAIFAAPSRSRMRTDSGGRHSSTARR
jgi:hypothetical protein